jgi:shikimate kinase
MGSGKSAVGRILAERLALRFEDTDARVEEATGLSIEEIFRTHGEGRFREAEWHVLQSLVEGRAVVATGGGLFLGVVQRRAMKQHGTVVWLDAPLPVVRARIGDGAGRPLWSSGDPIRQRAFFEKRRAAYALADFRVDAAADPETVAQRCALRLNANARES